MFLCSTTDPYQTIRNEDVGKQKLLNVHARQMLRDALEAIRDHSTLNVRILTRSPLAREDFDIFKTFGDRLLLGTSLPTLDPVLGRLYEPKVPSPAQRLKLLTDAHAAGIFDATVPTGILTRIVQKRADGFFLIGTVFHGDAGTVTCPPCHGCSSRLPQIITGRTGWTVGHSCDLLMP